MRDGVTVYVDVYRPEGATDVPVILAPFYAKTTSGALMQGVVPGTVSKMSKTESADPGYWCHKGYAIINIDPRGNGYSGRDTHYWGTPDGEDGYDIVEWAAAQDWSNGKVGSFGNSGVAMETLFIAAAKPPHLACIAAWEASADLYRGFLSQGGVPLFGMTAVLSRMQYGAAGQYTEDILMNYMKYDTLNAYWEDKHAKLEEIDIPSYICGGLCHFHLRGSIEAFKNIGTPKKWLRLHRDFEWPDDCEPENMDDLTRFFDRYLKGIHNGWEMTPKVRVDVCDRDDILYQHNRPEKAWPIKRTKYEKLYLDAAGMTLREEPIGASESTSYDSADDHVVFTYKFQEETELTGHVKLKLWVSAENKEMDLIAFVQKGDEDGNFVPVTVIGEPHPGFTGMLRVSLRELDEEASTEYQPVHKMTTHEYLEPGQIVPVEIEILPMSMIFHKGETLRLVVSGNYEREPGWFEPLVYATQNEGAHTIYAGGEYDSYLQVPVIPPRISSGGYVLR